MSLYQAVTERLPELIRHRRYFHTHAEAGYELPKTLAYMKVFFDDLHIPYWEPVSGALVVDLGLQEPRLLLRADTDALPMHEENELPYKSVTPYAHTCGHDLHSAMMMEAARMIKLRESELKSGVRIVFQPDEEGVTGAETLIRAGVLQPAISAAYALHVSPTMPSGVLHYTDGAMYASSDTISITVQGHGGHGAAPHIARDPIFAAVQIYNALQGLITRGCPPHEMAVLSICTFQAGEAFNVIPEIVQMTGTLRTYNESLRTQLKEQLMQRVPDIAQACNTQAVISFPTGTPAVVCDADVQNRFLAHLQKELPEGRIERQAAPFSWSEDFGLFGEHIPVSMMTLGAQVGTQPRSIHDPFVQFDESAMVTGCTALAAIALNDEPVR